jgi:Fe-S cluster assembly iron-binding protein IscA
MSQQPMIEINEAEKTKIKEILAKNPGKCLRIALEGDGCAGPYYGVTLDAASANETTIRINGIDILVSEEVKRYAEISTINIVVNKLSNK